jgi:hypothetical protein
MGVGLRRGGSSNVVDEVCAEMDDWRTAAAGTPGGSGQFDVTATGFFIRQQQRAFRIMKGTGIARMTIDSPQTMVEILASHRPRLQASRWEA